MESAHAASGGRRAGQMLLLAAGLLALVPWAQAEKVSFRQAVELAVKRSAGMGMAVADQVRARQGYLEARNMYVPQVTFGSGVAKSWGFPMSIEGSAPSIFNVTTQSFLYNPAQQEFMRAARRDWQAASLWVEDQRSLTMLETALTYIQLTQAENKLNAAHTEVAQAERAMSISQERQQAGVSSQVDVTRANLNAARARMRQAGAQGNSDLLRKRLAQLTGLDERELEVDAATLPASPEISQQDDLSSRAVANSPAVKASDEKAQATQLRAKGEHKQLYPAIDLVGNYGLFTKYNNYDLYFKRFSRNNATFGVAIRFPFLNSAQRSHADAADADALKAKSQAEITRQQVANDTLKLQRSVEQLTAARDVARLEYELARANVDAIDAKVQTGNATINDQEAARIDVMDKYAILQDAEFELDRAQLQVLRATGDLEKWALP